MDALDSIPVDESKKPSEKEMQLVNKYFSTSSNSTSSKSTVSELKIVLIATLLFVALSNIYFDKLLDFLPYTDNVFIRIALKALIFAVLMYVAVVFCS